MPEVIGREPELAVLEEFLDRDTPWLAPLLTGGPGIGKTALWERGPAPGQARNPGPRPGFSVCTP
jgi:ATP-dependent Clp protease ATP-binding subunit ClpA